MRGADPDPGSATWRNLRASSHRVGGGSSKLDDNAASSRPFGVTARAVNEPDVMHHDIAWPCQHGNTWPGIPDGEDISVVGEHMRAAHRLKTSVVAIGGIEVHAEVESLAWADISPVTVPWNPGDTLRLHHHRADCRMRRSQVARRQLVQRAFTEQAGQLGGTLLLKVMNPVEKLIP